MGMYTELVLEGSTKDPVPNEVLNILGYFFGDNEKPIELPNHPFFNLPRWHHIGHVGSCYHHPRGIRSMYEVRDNSFYLFMRCDIKNYDNEIAFFLHWVTHYLDSGFKGWVHYEEDCEPTLLKNYFYKKIAERPLP